MTRRTKRAAFIALCALGIFSLVLACLANYYWQTIDVPIVPLIAIQIPMVGVAVMLAVRQGETPRARTHWFLGSLAVGAPFLVLFAFGHVCAWNAWLDRSPPIEHRLEVLDAGRKARGQRRLEVPSWRSPGEREVLWISVEVADAPALIVTTRAGALGYEWIADVRVP